MDTLFNLPATDTLTVDYNGRDSVLSVDEIHRTNGRIRVRSHMDGEPDQTMWFTRRGSHWYWPSEGGHASLVAYQVGDWLEAVWQVATDPR